jgi:uncharacterized protein
MDTIDNGIVRLGDAQARPRVGLGGFLLLAFALSWLGAAPMVLGSWLDKDSPAAWHSVVSALAPLQLLMFFGALLATLIATLVNHGRKGLVARVRARIGWRVGIGWYLLVLGAPGLIAVAAAIGSRWIDPSLSPFSLHGSALLAVLQIFGVYVLFNTEEIAWRGYVLPRLQTQLRPLQANLVLALVWGLFHSPYFMMKGGHPGGYGVVTFSVMILAISLVMGMVFNATRGSVLICHLLHQSLNAWSEGLRLFPVMNHGSPWPSRLMVCGFVCVGAFAAFWLWRKGRVIDEPEATSLRAACTQDARAKPMPF